MITLQQQDSGSNGLSKSDRDVAILHISWGIGAGALLLLSGEGAIGVRWLLVVVFYNVLIPAVARWREHPHWLEIWLFALPLSILQVIPDWFLVEVLGILVFPDDGLFKIGAVSGYMAGLWVVPLFIIVYAGTRMQERRSQGVGYLAAAAIALLVFGASEATLWRLGAWHAQDVTMIGHVAVYVLPPEVLLGVVALGAHRWSAHRRMRHKVLAAGIVMLVYLGSLCTSYLLIERLLLS